MMGPIDDNSRRSPFVTNHDPSSSHRTVPILQLSNHNSTSSSGDPMDVTPPTTASMAPPSRTSPDNDTNGTDHNMGQGPMDQSGSLAGPNAAAAAAAGAQQPKVVQTAFIHKLYNMLEDPTIQHLISWSNSAESFVMSPSTDFSKVLSQYFKHTNISSFVRQLNMYGFHKVSDVFHNGSPESPLWEFKHGNGNFKRGDLVGLREIKRRASRQALVHRDSYPAPKPPHSQPGTPAEPMQQMQIMESTESRLTNLEHTIYDMHARLSRSEEANQFLHVRNQVVMDTLARSLQLHSDLSRAILSLVPNPDSPTHRDIIGLQSEIQRTTDMFRTLEEQPPDTPFNTRHHFSNLSLDPSIPVSPRQMAQDDPRRPPPYMNAPPQPQPQPPRNNFYRPPVPSHLSITPRRYGSVAGPPSAVPSPSSLRPQLNVPSASATLHPHAQPQNHPSHPLANVQSPPMGLSRRHTSADIRVHGWNGQGQPAPYTSNQNNTAWPSSPKRGPMDDSRSLRDSLSTYSLAGAQGNHPHSRPASPPLTNGSSSESLNTWSWGQGASKGFGGNGLGSGLFKHGDNSGPPTRRGSMAHILNPAETREEDEEEEEEEREGKRKRLG